MTSGYLQYCCFLSNIPIPSSSITKAFSSTQLLDTVSFLFFSIVLCEPPRWLCQSRNPSRFCWNTPSLWNTPTSHSATNNQVTFKAASPSFKSPTLQSSASHLSPAKNSDCIGLLQCVWSVLHANKCDNFSGLYIFLRKILLAIGHVPTELSLLDTMTSVSNSQLLL